MVIKTTVYLTIWKHKIQVFFNNVSHVQKFDLHTSEMHSEKTEQHIYYNNYIKT